MTYPHPCTHCGYCCLVSPCPVELRVFGPRAPGATCPALSFDGDKSHCAMVEKLGPEIMGSNTGCCISATAVIKGQKIDFAAMPEELKIMAARSYRQGTGIHLTKSTLNS